MTEKHLVYKRIFFVFFPFILISCATTVKALEAQKKEITQYNYFAKPDPDGSWTRKIRKWQTRAKRLKPQEAIHEAQEKTLYSKYVAFQKAHKRISKSLDAIQKQDVAHEFARWIQAQSKIHYIRETEGKDFWETLDETLTNDGADCEGLNLLPFYGLLDLGFDKKKLFRAIMYRQSDGGHHMVNFWFEDRDDPWVIDPRGAVSDGMKRFSEIDGWIPIKMFNETEEFTVRFLLR